MSIHTGETKLSLKKETVDKLRSLVQINLDSASGFREAADAIDDGPLAQDFRVWAADRTRQADELAEFVTLNDAEPPQDKSWTASLHQVWLDLRAAMSGGEAYAVLAEAERGEDAIKVKYEEVLKDTAGSAVNDVLQSQYLAVKGVHDRVRDLRDARKRKK